MKKITKPFIASLLALGLLSNGPMRAAEPGKIQQLSQGAQNFFQALNHAPHCITRSKTCRPEDRRILLATAKNFLKILVVIIAGLAIKRRWTKSSSEAAQPGMKEGQEQQETPKAVIEAVFEQRTAKVEAQKTSQERELEKIIQEWQKAKKPY